MAGDGRAETADEDTSGALLTGLARLAVQVSGLTAAAIIGGPGVFASSGLRIDAADIEGLLAACGSEAVGLTIPDVRRDPRFQDWRLTAHGVRLRSLTLVPLPGISRGWLIVGCSGPAAPAPGAARALTELAALAAGIARQSKRNAALADITRRAVRADRMLRLVSEAVSCADALTSLLGELCRHHGAPVGRIWKLDVADGMMREVSRFNEHAYYQQSPSSPVRAGNSMTAAAIARNQPQTSIYSQVTDTAQFALLAAAMESGLASQVSYPIWVQEQRFGISLAFVSEREDLDEIVADIASLANTIRPALFRKVTEERIRHMALHDDLTQLGNRTVFNECLGNAVTTAARGEQGLALLYLDLDGFKRVNDMRGHEVGDKLLAAVAGRLRAGVREGDTVARLGGDEFAVVQPRGGQPYEAVQLAQRLVHMLGQPFDIDGQPSLIGASVGIALYPADGTTPDALLRNADAALYDAKGAGRNTCRLFEPSLASIQEEKFLIERDIKEAFEREAFTLAYQPICDAMTLEVRGLEALLRWNHPVKGPMPPARFVPVAEASGLILPLGWWAFETSCTEAATWAEPVCLSVNFSPLQFRQPGLTEQIAEVLARTGLAPTRLHLEVTEGLLLDDTGSVLHTMQALRAQGIQITLDDFGTAFASLSTLRRFPFDGIKIDMSFIQGMCSDDGTLAIVEALLSLGERLNLNVVAEGVETEEELETLRRLGCRRVQGYLTGRPMPRERVRLLLADALRAAG